MGKTIDAQSIVVSSSATNQQIYRHRFHRLQRSQVRNQTVWVPGKTRMESAPRSGGRK